MHAVLPSHEPPFGHDPSCDLVVILERARTLQHRGWHPSLRTQLKGMKLASLSARAADAAPMFREVATAMGADVMRVPSTLSLRQSPKEIRRTAHVLGRFYDAVNCEGIDADLVRLLQTGADTPVFDDLCSMRHCIARLADLLDPACSIEENHRWVVMGALVAALD